jgi:mevalonate kinase
MENNFRANGKLLLTGEYAIIFGATGLVLPLNRFQEMQVNKIKEPQPRLYWKAYDVNGLWFEAQWLLPDFSLHTTSNPDKAAYVLMLLQAIRNEKPAFLADEFSYVVTHFCNFDIHWGLGSSSTLLVNLCRWAMTDPFRIYFKLFHGSAYDIAAAQINSPLIYNLSNNQPHIQSVSFNPPFLDQIMIIYSGRKQDTRKAIAHIKTFDENIINRISQLTLKFVSTTDIYESMEIVREHEILIGQQIGEQPIQEKYFSDFRGQIKSLGAWGGDFWLAISEMSQSEVTNYFDRKGYRTVFPLKTFMM